MDFDKLLSSLLSQANGQPAIPGLVVGYTSPTETKYLAASGVLDLDTNEKATVDLRLAFFSCTKTMTAMAVLQLWEQNRVDLDAPAKLYLPILGDMKIVHSDDVDDETGEFKVAPKAPKVDVTLRHLLLQQAGFAYMFTDPAYYSIVTNKYPTLHAANVQPEMFRPEVMPLLFEPGTQWKYGHSFDWAGLVVEAVSGMRLSEYLKQHIWLPAGITSFTFHTNRDQMFTIYNRRGNGQFRKTRSDPVELDPKVDMGGQGCFGTVGDFLKLLRIWLNYGESDTGARILKRETVEYALKNHLPANQTVEFQTSVDPDPDAVGNGWTLGGMAQERNVCPLGRPKGTLFWSGLANLYYWIDFQNRVAGIFACQTLPTLDRACYEGYEQFERLVYSRVKSKL